MQDWAGRLPRLLFRRYWGLSATHAYENKYVGMLMSGPLRFANIGLSDELAIASGAYLSLDRPCLK
jgi:hypothetical protein